MIKGRPAKVSYKQWDNETKSVKIIQAPARFHCWGIRKPKETNPKFQLSETVGVCELEDGAIRLVLPEKIRFLDKIDSDIPVRDL